MLQEGACEAKVGHSSSKQTCFIEAVKRLFDTADVFQFMGEKAAFVSTDTKVWRQQLVSSKFSCSV